MPRVLSRGAALVALLLVILIYGCDAGHGFVKDDFGWVVTSRLQQPSDLQNLLGAPTGFFRPLVSLSFAIDYALFDAAPRGYGLTNLALLLACIGMLAALFRAMRLRAGVAVAAALVWALNFHGINMAVLWISGRTALTVTFWAVAATWAWTRGHRMWAALFAVAAMWSKEEGFMVAAILTAWTIIDRRPGRETWTLWAVAAIALAVRAWSGAFTPGTAPPLYQYQVSLTTLANNIIQYADRSATTAAGTLLVFWIAAGLPRGRTPRLVAPEQIAPDLKVGPTHDDRAPELKLGPTHERARWLKGLAWFVLGFAPTIFLPVRSSLYALLPGVGVVLIAGDLANRIVDRAPSRAIARATTIVLLLLVALVPVYRLRNQRYVGEAELSAAIVAEVSKIAATAPAGGLILIKDVRNGRPTAEQAFGPVADRMAELTTGGKLQVWIDPPPVELAGVAPPPLSSAVATLVVEHGIVRVDR